MAEAIAAQRDAVDASTAIRARESDGARTRDGLPQPAQPLAAPRPLPRRSGSNNLCVPIQRCDRQLPACWAATRGTGRARFAARAFWPMLALDAAPHHFKTATRAVAGAMPAGQDWLGPGGGSGPCGVQNGQQRSSAEIHLLYAVRRVFELFAQPLNANDELLRSFAIAAAFAKSVEPLQLCGRATAVENAAPHVVADRRDRTAPARRQGDTGGAAVKQT